MTRPIVRVHNVETNEVLDREMNDEEFADYQERQEAFVQEHSATLEREAEREALLARLNITSDEAKLLLG
jgi:hypothetical protein